MGKAGALGTVAIVLALATPASAATTYTVDPNKAAAGCDGTTCKTIDEAAGPAVAGDTIRLLAGFYAQPAAFTEQLTVTGFGAGSAVIIGTVTFSANGILQRVAVSGQGSNPAVLVTPPTMGARAVTIESSILTGAGTGAGIEATGPSGLGTTTVDARHVTVADSGSAPATKLVDGLAGTAAAAFTDSIVLGTHAGNAPTLSESDTNDSAAHQADLFVNPANETYLLRVGSPAIDQGRALQAGESATDIDGETRPSGAANDDGADEFVNHPPAAPGLVADKVSAAPGEQITFGAFAGPQPDADRGDGVAKYRFDFGDGSGVVEQTSFAAVHAYAAPGQYTVTAKTVDIPGAESVPSNAGTITIAAGGSGGPSGPDVAAPTLSIISPRPGQRLKRGRRAPVLRGRTRDATGVRAVELALRRFEGRRCRWYDGRRAFLLGSCTRPRFFRALIDDFAWSYTFPRRIVPGVGRYELRARATDFLGHRTTAFSASSRTLAGFRIVR